MKYNERCSMCGHQKTAYTISLNEPMALAFVRFAESFMSGGRRGIKKGEIGLSNAQYSNFQNLRHFGIIRQYEKGNEWYLTDFGERFYYGEVGIEDPVAHMDGETLSPSHEAWKSHTGDKRKITINSLIPTHYKSRPEYRAEKSNQLAFSI